MFCTVSLSALHKNVNNGTAREEYNLDDDGHIALYVDKGLLAPASGGAGLRAAKLAAPVVSSDDPSSDTAAGALHRGSQSSSSERFPIEVANELMNEALGIKGMVQRVDGRFIQASEPGFDVTQAEAVVARVFKHMVKQFPFITKSECIAKLKR